MITLPRNRKGPRECIGRILIGEGCRRRACQSSIFTRYYYVVRPSQAGVNDEHEPAQLPGRSPRPERPDLSPRLSQRRPPRQRRTAPPRQRTPDLSRRRLRRLRRHRRLPPLERQHLGRPERRTRHPRCRIRATSRNRHRHRRDLRPGGRRRGISGLAAAIFFQKYLGGGALVIDNHPIFGGEAKRNEFLVDGQRLTAHQGSAIFLVPGKGGYTDRFYEMIGMDRSAFAYQTWRGPSPEMPLAHSPYETPGNYGFYFGPQFGQRPGGGGKGGVWVMDPWGRKPEGAPISDATRAERLRWGTNRVDGPRPQTEGDAISRQLDRVTLEDHLMTRYNISRETVRTFLSPVEGGGYGLGPDVLSAYCNYAIENQFPEDGDDTLGDQMVPDGNGGFARLNVQTLIPDAFAGPRTVDAVCQNRVSFRALDRAGESTRIRLDATVVRVEHAGNPSSASQVIVTYAKGNRLYKVRARRGVVAGGSWT